MATVTLSREQMQTDAHSRAVGGQSLSNWPAIIAGFQAKGIPAHEVRPRETCSPITPGALAAGQVRRGEHGETRSPSMAADSRGDDVARQAALIQPANVGQADVIEVEFTRCCRGQFNRLALGDVAPCTH
jgi:hypothetical protein